MKAAPIFVVLAAGAMLGWYAPGSMEPGGASGAQEVTVDRASQEQTRADPVRQQQWYAGNVVLQRAPDGHFYADVAVGGATRKLLVDTGASVMALTGRDAAAMGIQWQPTDVQPVASGASGPVYGVPVTLDTVRLGRIEASGVRAIIVPEGLSVSLLGQSFLSQIEKLEIEQDRMVLGG